MLGLRKTQNDDTHIGYRRQLGQEAPRLSSAVDSGSCVEPVDHG
jgi:hypothetical protein